jgi:hypothetical protein
MTLNEKLIEVLYMNEYVCNFINKDKCEELLINKEIEQLCNYTSFQKKLIYAKVTRPKLDFSPIKNNNNHLQDTLHNIYKSFTMRLIDNDVVTHLFVGFEKLASKKTFFNDIIKLSNKLNKLIFNNIILILSKLYSQDNIAQWSKFIDEHFFDTDGKFIYTNDIIHIYKKISDTDIRITKNIEDYTLDSNKNTFKHDNHILYLLLGQLMLYYFYTNNKKHQDSLKSIYSQLDASIFIKSYCIIYNDSKTNMLPIKECVKELDPSIFKSIDNFNDNYETLKSIYFENLFDKTIVIYKIIIECINKKEINIPLLFTQFNKHADNKFIDYCIELNKKMNDFFDTNYNETNIQTFKNILIQLFNKNNIAIWFTILDKYLFSNTEMNASAIIKLYDDIHFFEIKDPYNFLKLLLGTIMLYYFNIDNEIKKTGFVNMYETITKNNTLYDSIIQYTYCISADNECLSINACLSSLNSQIFKNKSMFLSNYDIIKKELINKNMIPEIKSKLINFIYYL